MHSAEIKREIPFCTCKRILEYSGIEIRQFTHSAEIKREIPFCTRKRSETNSKQLYVSLHQCRVWYPNINERFIPRAQLIHNIIPLGPR